MENSKLSALVILFIAMALSIKASAQTPEKYAYAVSDQKLYTAIVHMDSVYFNAYNSCDMNKQAAIYADTIEFYHDKGGLMTSKQALLNAIKRIFAAK